MPQKKSENRMSAGRTRKPSAQSVVQADAFTQVNFCGSLAAVPACAVSSRVASASNHLVLSMVRTKRNSVNNEYWCMKRVPSLMVVVPVLLTMPCCTVSFTEH